MVNYHLMGEDCLLIYGFITTHYNSHLWYTVHGEFLPTDISAFKKKDDPHKDKKGSTVNEDSEKKYV